jgi:hypothetical protein
MRTRLVFALVGVLGCTSSGPSSVDKAEPVTPTPPPTAEPDPKTEVEPEPDAVASAIDVQMTAATLADDCGGGPNTRPTAPAAKAAIKQKSDESPRRSRSPAMGDRACEQSSIQLAIAAPAGAEPAEVAVKSVELLLESGASVGKLAVRAPSVWSEAEGYTPWDQKVAPGQDLSVSYALTEPDWSKVEDRWNQTYTVKAVLSIGGSDRTVQQSVAVDAPTSLPPGVKT